MVTLGRRASSPAGRRELTLAGQFLALQLVVVALLLAIVGVVSVRQSTATFTTDRGSAMRSVAEYLASFAEVRGLLAATDPGGGPGGADAELARRLAPVADRGASLSGASDVLVVDADGVVVGATDPAQVGVPAELGTSDALEGRGWVGDVDVGAGQVVAAHAPVYDDEGVLRGIVVAEQDYPSLWQRLTGAGPDLALYLGLGALLGVLGSVVVSRIVKRRTQGLGPREIAALADHREALLHSIREGVVAVDTDGRVTMVNDAARRLLGLDVDPLGRTVEVLGLDPQVASLLAGEGEVADAVTLVGDRVVVLNRRAASSRGRGIGTVTTLRDRTELLSLQSRLEANLSISDTLRAQTHEFDNRLHTISGLVQLGEYDEVRTLVGTLTRRRTEIGAQVTDRIADPAVAALMVAKDAVAHERGVTLVLDPGSRLPALEADLSAQLTTVLGNLVDNAVDACAGAADEAGPVVEVWLTTLDDAVHLRVRDNGPGVPDELRRAVFDRGFSTKPAGPDVPGGRGIGLPLVRLVCRERGGTVVVDRSGPDGGAEFRVVLPLWSTDAARVGAP